MKYDRTLDKTPPISQKMENDFYEKGFITGSARFGGYVEGKSDMDICIPPVEGFTFDDMFQYGWYDVSEYSQHSEFRCVYYKTMNGTVLNILFFKKHEDWLEWRTVTGQFMKMIYASNKLKEAVAKDKTVRVNFFETLRHIFYGHRFK